MRLLVIKLSNKEYDSLSVEGVIEAESKGKNYRMFKNISSKDEWMNLVKKMELKSFEELINYTILIEKTKGYVRGCCQMFDSEKIVESLRKLNK